MADLQVDDKKQLTSSEIEKRIKDDYKKNQPATSFCHPLSATSLFVPKIGGFIEHTITITDTKNPDKAILYMAIVAAYNYVLFDKDAAKSAKAKFASTARHFVSWLNQYEIKNRYKVLKEFETYRMDELNNHGGYSPLIGLMTILTYALESEEFRNEVSEESLEYLYDLKQTKISPNVNKSQKSLVSYFGAMDWLRREDVGVGNELYAALASPKLAINSLSLTASTIILELNEYKKSLKEHLLTSSLDLSVWLHQDYSALSRKKKEELVGNILYQVISFYHNIEKPSYTLTSALELLVLSNAKSKKSYQSLLSSLDSQAACDGIFLNKNRLKNKVSTDFCDRNIGTSSGNFLSIDMLSDLLSDDDPLPISEVERMMFSWLMASLTVQPWDIPKLTHDSFKTMRVGNQVVHIECEYFKGRARVFHTTRSLSTKTVEGKALLTFLASSLKGQALCYQKQITISKGINSNSGAIRFLLLSTGINLSLKNQHQRQNLPLLIPPVLCALISKGTHKQNVVLNAKKYSTEELTTLTQQSETPIQRELFSLQAIKNSAVHAFSDPYTLHYLINRNSHTNKTEKAHYLNEDNEEWINSAGRITREVMLDLINNVFDLDFDNDPENDLEIERFNSEFMAVSETVSYKTEEMNARLRMITGKGQGQVNEVGILSLSDKADEDSLSPIYVVDSPLTALKMYNYLHEFQKHYKRLLARNPDFLYKTAMPTVEWMEFTLNQMSKKSQQNGLDQFQKMVKNNVVMSVFHSI
ncbi:hypothetical protein AB4440_16500 [Vibrio splendidus]|uniref:hypothetical protein n=1 Tax=Vibrio splendidus TaxID=29497 RepID=UPI000C86471B|nr:hypothetical protein [Vibrio splendidus]PMO94800.1 hypothetical protein BCS97_16185 [Vibrio splendidus]PMP23773.1 hypothetical protein BCS89_15635 [Vibrio splendidus]PMP37960.1 hypothetical protein BCS88_04875 [Vibrio splendidus]PMP39869.1 hypothetical protein BCS87_08980 [Vibrio splendidus]PMP48298.1 hypothetical protein BCS85_09680 [Vibrio splendidus]